MMRWWGWGRDEDAIELPPAAAELLRGELGLSGDERGARVALDEVQLAPARLGERARRALEDIVGASAVMDGREARVAHAAGRGYPDLVRLRAGDARGAPDAVALPSESAQLAPLLAACAEHRVAVIPFGGGTSVVGGVEALPGEHHAAVTLDLSRLDAVIDVDARSLTATVEPGIFGPALERQLGGSGLTLGHFPQSFEYSTVGGWVATRSAGQASTGYGRIDELVEAVRCTTPAGELATLDVPASAAGPSLRELVVGSEGVLGVISAATLRVRPAPAEQRYEAWSLPSFEAGAEAFRDLAQIGATPDVARLSDEDETRLTMALGSSGGLAEKAGKLYLRAFGSADGCIAFTGFDGRADDIARRRGRTAEILRAHGAVALGTRPGRSWLRGRFAAPYLRDELMDRGVMVETLETATTWSNLQRLYAAVGGALRTSLAEGGTPPAVMCHISHLYPSGASLYFTFVAGQRRGEEIAQWRAAKTAACDAIAATGGTITHHHAVGTDHRAWMASEVGELGVDVLRAVKARVDPAGIMNPGKLLP
ncbi:MAG TPA: FAD-binding oxidoreductase [Thermoleophilaceae bacterium]|nr:FAD-binding oxidoreductase [Thermoleophilaceae bacterium]